MLLRTYAFKVVVEPDEGGFHAYCPALRRYGAVTQGATQQASGDEVEVFEGTRVAVTV